MAPGGRLSRIWDADLLAHRTGATARLDQQFDGRSGPRLAPGPTTHRGSPPESARSEGGAPRYEPGDRAFARRRRPRRAAHAPQFRPGPRDAGKLRRDHRLAAAGG